MKPGSEVQIKSKGLFDFETILNPPLPSFSFISTLQSKSAMLVQELLSFLPDPNAVINKKLRINGSLQVYSPHKLRTKRSLKWTTEMDALVIQLHKDMRADRVLNNTCKTWRQLAEKINSTYQTKFKGKTVMEHYDEKLKPEFKRTQFSLHEDLFIMAHIAYVGQKWSLIAMKMGRSPNNVKNRFNSGLHNTSILDCITRNKEILKSSLFQESIKTVDKLSGLFKALEQLKTG